MSRIMYDGTNYHGFQLQPDGQATIQREIEKVLSKRFQQAVPVVAAGRTDGGVHAAGQVIHFDLENPDEDVGLLRYVMNQMLPKDIRVWDVSVAPPPGIWQSEMGLPWHAMLNAKGKVYSYRLYCGETQNPMDRLYRAHACMAARTPRINVNLLHEAIPLFVGKHDFVGYSNKARKIASIKYDAGFGDHDTWREVHSAKIIDEGCGNLRLEFHLDGALYRMVRNMVGAMLAVASGRIDIRAIDEIFVSGRRDSSKIYSAPAHGLTLEKVFYDDYG